MEIFHHTAILRIEAGEVVGEVRFAAGQVGQLQQAASFDAGAETDRVYRRVHRLCRTDHHLPRCDAAGTGGGRVLVPAIGHDDHDSAALRGPQPLHR